MNYAQSAPEDVLLGAFPELLKLIRGDNNNPNHRHQQQKVLSSQEALDAFVCSNFREMLARVVGLAKSDRVRDLRVLNAAVASFGRLCEFRVRTKADWEVLEGITSAVIARDGASNYCDELIACAILLSEFLVNECRGLNGFETQKVWLFRLVYMFFS